MLQGKEQPLKERETSIKTVLVVEDDTGIGTFLVQAILQETHYHALLVTDGFQAIKTVTNIKPSLFILDYQLPRMNGLELYDHLHGTKGLEHIPALIISARLPKQEIEKRKLDSMSKPLELDEFLQTVEKLLG